MVRGYGLFDSGAYFAKAGAGQEVYKVGEDAQQRIPTDALTEGQAGPIYVSAKRTQFMGIIYLTKYPSNDLFCPHKLIGFWDMVEFLAYNFGCLLAWLNETLLDARTKVKKSGRNSKITGRSLLQTRTGLEKLKDICEELNLVSSYDQCFGLLLKVNNNCAPCYWTDMESGLAGIKSALWKDLEPRCFAYIPWDKSAFFENDVLFGTRVNRKFPSLKSDIKNAGNCLAADLPTASVFYLMRIAELGMRALATHLGVEIVRQKQEKKCQHCKKVISEAGEPKTIPIDYAMWDEVLQELTKKIDSLENATKGANRTEDFKFYYGLRDDLQKFKNVDRNELFHARRIYSSPEAIVVFNGVKGFMIALSGLKTEAHK